MRLFSKESIEAHLEENKNYTKDEIIAMLDKMESDYDFEKAKKRIRHFAPLVSQRILEDIISAISNTKEKSFYD